MEAKLSKQASGRSNRKSLQSHVAFFDTDNDGIIWPSDTYKGFRAIGFNPIFALLSMIIIHISFSFFTVGTLIPDPFFRILVPGIHRALHGSDTGTYTQLGELDERRFNYVFDLYSAPPHTHLSFGEGVNMLRGNRNLYDFFGWFAAVFEWGTTYLLLWPEDGRVSKQDVHDILDGSLFPRLAEKNAKEGNTKKTQQDVPDIANGSLFQVQTAKKGHTPKTQKAL
ncbi:Caleosin related protein-domain-containing protein [Mycena galericulata]|nr:Caleosin related protein-domain-containing protein [Mycena galericulata]